jgi:hypothetical protein
VHRAPARTGTARICTSAHLDWQLSARHSLNADAVLALARLREAELEARNAELLHAIHEWEKYANARDAELWQVRSVAQQEKLHLNRVIQQLAAEKADLHGKVAARGRARPRASPWLALVAAALAVLLVPTPAVLTTWLRALAGCGGAARALARGNEHGLQLGSDQGSWARTDADVLGWGGLQLGEPPPDALQTFFGHGAAGGADAPRSAPAPSAPPPPHAISVSQLESGRFGKVAPYQSGCGRARNAAKHDDALVGVSAWALASDRILGRQPPKRCGGAQRAGSSRRLSRSRNAFRFRCCSTESACAGVLNCRPVVASASDPRLRLLTEEELIGLLLQHVVPHGTAAARHFSTADEASLQVGPPPQPPGAALRLLLPSVHLAPAAV